MKSSKMQMKDGQTVDLVDSRISDENIASWEGKLNGDGSNATTDGVTNMMKKVQTNSVISTPADTEYYYASDDNSIVRRPIRNIWNYIKSKLGSAGASDNPIYLENGVPKACDTVLPTSVIDSGSSIGYGVYVGGNPTCGANTRCYCSFLITASAAPDSIAHTYIGTFTFKAGVILNSELKCLTGTPQYPLRIGVSFNRAADGTYAVGLYIIPADKTVNTYTNYKLTRVASSAFTWAVQAATEDAYNDIDTIAKPSLRPIVLSWIGNASNVRTTGGTWRPTFDRATIIDCRGYVDLSVQVDLSVIDQTTYVSTLASYDITLVNSAGTDILPPAWHQKGNMPRATKSMTAGGTVDISCTHRFIFPITASSNLLAGYRPQVTLPSNYPLDSTAQVHITAICSGIIMPYYGVDTSF